MSKSAEYISSAYSFIYSYPLEKLLEVGYQSKEGNPIPSFDEELLIDLCSEAQETFEKEENILEIEGDLIIVGDIHGSLHDLLRILKFIHEKNKKVLFLGDYVDRGNFSLECITILFAMKILYPTQFYLLRGNHEFDSICSQYGFKAEILNHHNPKKLERHTLILQRPDASHTSNNSNDEFQRQLNLIDQKNDPNKEDHHHHNHNHDGEVSNKEFFESHENMDCYKYSEKLYDAFIQAFAYLPICAIVNKTTFCIHGGLSPRLEDIDSLKTLINRPINTFEESILFSDVVWSDPSESSNFLFIENPRGRGCMFNKYSVGKFLQQNSHKRLVRAHQCVKKGSLIQFGEMCITVFSASSYDKAMGNCSAILELFQKDDNIDVITFSPLKRLQKSDASYYKVESLNAKKTNIHKCFSFLHPNMLSNMNLRMVTTNHGKKIRTNASESLILIQNPSAKLTPLIRPRLCDKPSSLSGSFDSLFKF